jgi:NADPH:quinone reductase-like Zn-dependent oxidoreductase
MKRLLADEGKLVYASASSMWGFVRLLAVSARKRESIELIVKLEKSMSRLEALLQFFMEGKLRPVIDREYPFDQVKAAIDYVATFRARGKVIINLGH